MQICKNDRIKLDIISLDNRFYGVAKPDGFTVFVKDALPGESVDALIIKVQKNYAVAKVMSYLSVSEDRTEPLCPAYRTCGGCSCMHISYEAQLKYKWQAVRDSMERIGGFKGITVSDIIPSDKITGYRNKAQLPVSDSGIGFYRRMSHDITDISECMIQSESVSSCIKALRTYMSESHDTPYNEKTGKGNIRHLVVRTSSSGCVYITVVINGKIRNESLLIKHFSENVKDISGICLNINRRRDNVIMGHETRVIFGSPYLTETLLDKTFNISPASFFQVNRQQTEKLYSEAGRLLDLKEGESLFDIYCGIGTIGICLHKPGVKLIGIEQIDAAVKDAATNAKINNINNAEYYCGNAEDVLPALVSRDITADCAVIDPPRGGCDKKLLDTLANLKMRRIVYISCNPSTLARDCKILSTEYGYSIEHITPVDMFPMTEHVETVVLLSRA